MESILGFVKPQKLSFKQMEIYTSELVNCMWFPSSIYVTFFADKCVKMKLLIEICMYCVYCMVYIGRIDEKSPFVYTSVLGVWRNLKRKCLEYLF